MPLAVEAKRLVLQPMAGAASLRKWLIQNGWCLVAEDLVEDGRHLYEIMAAERGAS
jgi:tRNA (adenine22-N1)-methyltransferase